MNNENKQHSNSMEEEELTNQMTESQSDKPESEDMSAIGDKVTNEIDEIRKELATLNDSHLRLMAEYDNYRKRTLKEKSELIKNGGEKALTELLPVIDDMELALKNIKESNDSEAIKEGLFLIYNKFMDYLGRQGVKAIETENKPFDDEQCEAIAVVPAPNEESKGKILDCIKSGYTLNGKVIRHANVVVGQ